MHLLLLPGLLCDRASWDDVVRRLADVATCRVPDYGDADTLAAMARRVLANAPDRFALAGHSMGARVAVEVLRLAPARVTHLALLDTGSAALPAGAAGVDERARREALVALARREGMRALAHAWLPPMIPPERRDDAALVGAIVAMVERKTPQQFAAQVRALLARPDLAAFLPTVRVPTLVACGAEDGWSPLAQHEAIARLVPGARLVAIPGCGHMAPMERPDAVAAALRAWLGGTDDRRAAEAFPATQALS
jgi:pimeloyl-ACP methyl ester carboxylesterase